MRKFPNARLTGEVFFSTQDERDDEPERGHFWDQIIVRLSGLSQDQVTELGGYRVYETEVRTLYESAVPLS